jgi:hypothetical protein
MFRKFTSGIEPEVTCLTIEPFCDGESNLAPVRIAFIECLPYRSKNSCLFVDSKALDKNDCASKPVKAARHSHCFTSE